MTETKLLNPMEKPTRSGKTGVAIIAAAGSSLRMGSEDKLFLPLGKKEVLCHTLLAYQKASSIQGILVVTKKESVERVKAIVEREKITKCILILPGGDTRQESVRLALDEIGIHKLESKVQYIAIADGDRPLTTPEMIDKVMLQAYLHGAASAACPAVDTIKIADGDGFIQNTPERSMVWQAQTPQAAKLAFCQAGAYSAEVDDFKATDDNSLLERINIPVKLVDCGSRNIKITNPGDLEIAEAILALREESEK